jgi:hypothetical protein
MKQADETHTLTSRQRAAVAALLTGKGFDQIAAEMRIARSTLWRWRGEPGFQQALKTGQDQVFDDALGRLKGAAAKAITLIVAVVDDPEAKDDSRLRAAGMLLENAWRLKQSEELEGRLRELEQFVGGLR